MRIRKKLIFLHTFFSLMLALFLVVALRPAVGKIVQEAEEHEARLVMSVLSAKLKLLAFFLTLLLWFYLRHAGY